MGGYYDSAGESLCEDCCVLEAKDAGKDAWPEARARRITVNNRKAIVKVAHEHYSWGGSLLEHSGDKTRTRGQIARDTREYRTKYCYSGAWTLDTLIVEALGDGLIVDASGHPYSVIDQDNADYFTPMQCVRCNKDLGIWLTCLDDVSDDQGMEFCLCEDHIGENYRPAKFPPYTGG
jgi:hypothetical protein